MFLNGKWLGQAVTGTQRYAQEVSRRLNTSDARVVLTVPRGAEIPGWADGMEVKQSPVAGLLFEQIWLPAVALRGTVLSLSGSAPLLARRQIVTLFDASVFRFPETFTRAFVLWYRLLYRTSKYRARAALTISDFSYTELQSILSPRDGWLNRAYCGADHVPEAEPIEASQAENYVVAIGSPTARKNLGAVVPAIAEAGIRVKVVGVADARVFDGASLGEDWSAPNIELTGRLSDEDVVEVMRKAVALIFPSKYEGFGLPIVEAQRVGCPVIAAATSSLKEVGGDGALYFDAADPTEAVQLVRRLIDGRGERKLLVDAGRENARRYSWQDAADVVLKVCKAKAAL